MPRVEFTIKGRPSRWERTTEHRGERKTTAAHRRAKKNVAQHAFVAMRMARLKPFVGPVGVSVLAVYPRNKGCPTWATFEQWETGRRLYMPDAADVDNIAKLILDAIQPDKAKRGQPRPRPFCIGDDVRVCDLRAIKVMAAKGEEPHTLVTVETLEEP
jgi:Holliday junction resolvase RusA-like endonuclease